MYEYPLAPDVAKVWAGEPIALDTDGYAHGATMADMIIGYAAANTTGMGVSREWYAAYRAALRDVAGDALVGVT